MRQLLLTTYDKDVDRAYREALVTFSPDTKIVWEAWSLYWEHGKDTMVNTTALDAVAASKLASIKRAKK